MSNKVICVLNDYLREFTLNEVVRPKEFESLTSGTANRCSIQLSYERTFLFEVGIIS